jgi:UDP-N-acetylglucosamine 4,6-dehydratase/5-epimerase
MNCLIIGGTGTLGKATARRLLQSNKNKVTILSRSELNQKNMETEFQHHPNLTFVLGDVRDRDSMFRHMAHQDVAFHFAALKHVDMMEENPEECIKTNVQGTINIADAAQSCLVRHVIFSSTDKAVDPINIYGYCKAISEKILFRRNELQKRTRFSVFRWGNVIASQGSAIPLFKKSILESKTVNLTDPEMTRFFIKIDDAVEFMLSRYTFAPMYEATIPPMKSAKLSEIVWALKDNLGINEITINRIPIRRGEKLHEAIRSVHSENPLTSETCEKFEPSELRQVMSEALL